MHSGVWWLACALALFALLGSTLTQTTHVEKDTSHRNQTSSAKCITCISVLFCLELWLLWPSLSAFWLLRLMMCMWVDFGVERCVNFVTWSNGDDLCTVADDCEIWESLDKNFSAANITISVLFQHYFILYVILLQCILHLYNLTNVLYFLQSYSLDHDIFIP